MMDLSKYPARSRGGIASAPFMVSATKARAAALREFYSKNPKICLNCGETIPFEKKRAKYCCHRCAGIKNSNAPRFPVVYCICGGKTSSHTATYCSKKCFHVGMKIKFIEDWKNGLVVVNNGYNSSRIKKYLKEKHGEKCFKCGWCDVNEFTGKIPIQVHHVDGNSSNISEDNLELLCPNCHSLTGNFGALNKGNGRAYRYSNKKV